MSWYDKTKMICTKCGHQYTATINTLTLASQSYRRCPRCNEKTGEIIKKEDNLKPK